MAAFILLVIALVACTAGSEPPVAVATPEDGSNPPAPTAETSLETAAPAPPSPTPQPLPSATTTAVHSIPQPAQTPIPLGEENMTTYHTIVLAENVELDYAVVLPEGFTSGETYPVLLALPPGAQTQEMVAWGLAQYWGPEAQARGWIVLSPVAPGGQLFFKGAERLIPEFLDNMADRYQPEGSKFHLAGISNGGISAFRIATTHPQRFHSLIAAPGFPQTQDDFQKLDTLSEMPVAMFAGEKDTAWVGRMEETAEELSRLGGTVSLEVVAGEGHVIQSLAGGERLFDLLESFRDD